MAVHLIIMLCLMERLSDQSPKAMMASWYYLPNREMAYAGKKFDPNDGTIIASNTFPERGLMGRNGE